MAINFPGALDGTSQFGQPSGTSLLVAPDHAVLHDNLSTLGTALETLLGTTSGSNYLGTVSAHQTQLGTYVVNATPTANNIPVLDANHFLPPTALNPTTARLLSKVITATRVLTTASGDVAYTGVGFTPTSIIAICNIDGLLGDSIGVADSSKTNVVVGWDTNAITYQGNNLCNIATATGGTVQQAIVKSFDADGFTLTWIKTGSPTGTGKMIFLCFR